MSTAQSQKMKTDIQETTRPKSIPSQENTLKLELSEKLSLLEMLTELALKEADLIWTRYTAMLYTSTGLMGIMTFSLENQSSSNIRWLSLGCAVIGFVIAIVWMQIFRLSRYYYSRWQEDADYIVLSDENIKQVVRGRINPRIKSPSKLTASQYGMLIPIMFAIGWLFVLADAIGIIRIF